MLKVAKKHFVTISMELLLFATVGAVIHISKDISDGCGCFTDS
jgi:hypothetical protein